MFDGLISRWICAKGAELSSRLAPLSYDAGLMNKGESVENLIGEIFHVIVAENLIRFQNFLQIGVDEVEHDVHILTMITGKKDVANADDVLVIDQMTKNFDFAIGSHADDEMLEDMTDFLDRHLTVRLAMSSQTDESIGSVA